MKWKEYRRVRKEKVTAPSGLEYEIRAMSAIDAISVARYGNDPVKFSEEILLRCVVKPPLARKGTADKVGLDELDAQDATFLITRILEISGITMVEDIVKNRPRGLSGITGTDS